jgi:hypothetical protein
VKEDDSSDHITCFQLSDVQVLWHDTIFMHLSITFNIQWFSNCSPTMDVGFVKHMSDTFRVFKIQEYSVLLSPVLQ